MKRPLLEKRNYQIIIAGIILIAVGFILMSGGRSDDPEVFNPEIYNFRRIRLAPTLIILGLALQAYAILYRPKK
jgi:sulfite exporter TauE/SafE